MKRFDQILRVIYDIVLAGVIAPILLLSVLDVEVFGLRVSDDMASNAGMALLALLFIVGGYLEFKRFRAKQERDELK